LPRLGSRVRISSLAQIGLVVQLVRIPACHAGGREFESRPDRKGLIFDLVISNVFPIFVLNK
jgi:hypothetical protein